MEKAKQGMQAGMKTNVGYTYDFVVPALFREGYKLEYIKKEPLESLHLKEWRDWSTFQKRFFEHGSGLFVKISPFQHPSSFIIAQCLPILELRGKALENRPRLSIPADIMTKTIEENRIPCMLQALEGMQVYYFIYVRRTGAFALGRYADIPESHWELTYRQHENYKDRLCIRREYQKKLFKPREDLKKELAKILKA